MVDTKEVMSEIVREQNLQYFGKITEKSAPSSKKMVFSGFVSTTDPDLHGDVVAEYAYDKHIQQYRDRPVYLYQHDKLQPIGRVSKLHTHYQKDGKTGLYLEDVVLSSIPVVNEVIWPLMQDDVLTQQSVGMFSINGKMIGDLYVHEEVYLYECSLVTVAANPEALVDSFKNLDEYRTIQQLMKAYDEGKIPIKKQYSMYVPQKPKEEQPMNTNNGHPTTPDFADAKVLKATTLPYDPDGAVVTMPTKVEKNYVDVCDSVHVCKSTSRGSYMFQIGLPTEKGYKYDWDLVAASMCRVLGANGGAHFEKEAKVEIVSRIAEAYKTLGKDLPTASFEDGDIVLTVDKLSADALLELEYKGVTFKNNEGDIYKFVVFENDVKRIGDTIKSWSKSPEGIPMKAKSVLKHIWTSVEIDVEGNPDDDTDVAFLQQLITLIQAYRNRFNTADNTDCCDVIVPYFMGLSDEEKATVKSVIADLEKNISNSKSTQESNDEQSSEENSLLELEKSLSELGIVVVKNS